MIFQLKSECPDTLKMKFLPPLKICLFGKDKREHTLGEEAGRGAFCFCISTAWCSVLVPSASAADVRG